MVKADKADLGGACKRNASDWSQFLEEARQVCHGTRCNVRGEAQLDHGGC
jgi:hypothetical protein